MDKIKGIIWSYALKKELYYQRKYHNNDNCLSLFEKCKLEFWCQVRENMK